ncbi:Pre-mRNA-splicing factor cwc26 [Gnomoniopsis smithogilvyi]|uniref:Pre-mRNA-splicing factor cwc26 n=1 Tax=Gnomoniopsis smithogilvyi TaxID=1191159 RepID=A0A9W8YTL7_9PEZI|nr:Pre-mRNA-splicing factor cwc26 [Gnomoniopsis smithogilvyi]
MPSNISDYIASRYLTADPKPASKKRKRKHDKSSTPGLLIQDDDDWGASSSTRKSKHRDNEHDDDIPVTVGNVKDVRKTTKANWKSVGGSSDPANDESAAADAILASAAAENEAARAAEDDDPTIVQQEQQKKGAARMTDGSYAGLQSAAAVAAQLEQRQREEREQFEAEKRAGLVKAGEEETYYRDATGRRVDVSMKRAEARRAALDAEEAERKKKEALKGEVQVEEARKRKEKLEEAKGMTLARTADDEELNREMKGQLRWNDPMARFLEAEDKNTGAGGGSRGGTTSGSKASRRPVYKGACPPNRYGIKPGYRWDGVDRSNGFESERFKALNRRERNKDLSYQWQMDE